MAQVLKRKSDAVESNSVTKRRRIVIVNDKNWDEWVSATQTRNWLIKDPIIDWLSYHGATIAVKRPKIASRVLKAMSGRTPNNFTEFIMDQGLQFEKHLLDYLYSIHKDIITNIGGGDNARSNERANATIQAIKSGVPIIYNGVLHNDHNNTYGVPDLIVRSDWLDQIVKISPITESDAATPAPLLKDPHGKRARYHYRVIDIKYTTLYLAADGIHLLNAGSFPAYKGQLCIYNDALARIQGYKPPCAYVMGRKWMYKSQSTITRGSSCVERLGTIDFTGYDASYVEKTASAIQWIKDMRKYGANWNTTTPPLTRPELYPNMSNSHDHPWGAVKAEIAREIKEITDLWMCGPKNRIRAHKQRIYRWTDPRCKSSVLGINGKRAPVLDAIISINQQSKDLIRPPTIPRVLPVKQSIEFYIDFEFINDVLSDFSKLPIVDSPTIIFMIGVGYFEPVTGEWIFREFTVDALTNNAERSICEKFSKYIRDEAAWYECDTPTLVHWSHAENTHWTNAYERHGGIKRAWIPPIYDDRDREIINPQWHDLLVTFKTVPIVIKDCLSFGLKDVASAMSKHGFITTTWDQSSSCVDGTGAMLGAYRAYQESSARGIPLSKTPQLREIAKYNEVDCKVLGEIMSYLRGIEEPVGSVAEEPVGSVAEGPVGAPANTLTPARALNQLRKRIRMRTTAAGSEMRRQVSKRSVPVTRPTTITRLTRSTKNMPLLGKVTKK